MTVPRKKELAGDSHAGAADLKPSTRLDTPPDISAAARAFERGVSLFSRRRIEAAVKVFARAQSLGYDIDSCEAYRWQCRMLLGDFEQAWRISDRISSRRGPGPHALWDGLPFTDKRVLIRCLHGYGDAIQFLRYTRTMRRDASRIIVETHPEMVSLVERFPSIDEVTTWAEGRSPRREDWDRQIEVTELPRAFRTTLATVPAGIPYIDIGDGARARSALNLTSSGACRSLLKTGLMWASSMWNPARSLPLMSLLPVLDVPGCRFYSFQRGPRRKELFGIPRGFEIHDTSLHSPEIVDTAADLLNMDLLITVDTMAAHLAGALGKPVWTLLPWEADWRWMLNRSDTPWYPTMRLFRQPSPGAWEPVVEAVARELARFSA